MLITTKSHKISQRIKCHDIFCPNLKFTETSQCCKILKHFFEPIFATRAGGRLPTAKVQSDTELVKLTLKLCKLDRSSGLLGWKCLSNIHVWGFVVSSCRVRIQLFLNLYVHVRGISCFPCTSSEVHKYLESDFFRNFLFFCNFGPFTPAQWIWNEATNMFDVRADSFNSKGLTKISH